MILRFLSLLLLCTTLCSVSVLGLTPKKEYSQTPRSLRLPFEELQVKTQDGATLNVWYFPSNQSDQLIVLSHDGIGNMGDYLDRVKVLRTYGFNVLTYDYRGYGSSSNFEINSFVYVYKEFFDDFETIIQHCSQQYKHQIVTYGWGVGGGITIAKGFNYETVTGIVADDPFLDFDHLKTKFKEIKTPMTIPLSIESSEYNVFDIVSSEPGKKLRGILYLHSDRNFLFDQKQMSDLLSVTTIENKELHKFKKSGGSANFKISQSGYARSIYAFVMNL